MVNDCVSDLSSPCPSFQMVIPPFSPHDATARKKRERERRKQHYFKKCVALCNRFLCTQLICALSGNAREVVYPAPALVRTGELRERAAVPALDRPVIRPRVRATRGAKRERADSPPVRRATVSCPKASKRDGHRSVCVCVKDVKRSIVV